MTLTFHWFLPSNGGDGRHVVGGGHGVRPGASSRPADVPYLGQVARAAEQSGFEAALTPAGAWCEGVLPILAERGLWKDPRPERRTTGAVPFSAVGTAAS